MGNSAALHPRHPPRHHAPRKPLPHRHAPWPWIAAAIVAGTGLAAWALWPDSPSAGDATAQLVAQMRAAAAGQVAASHAYGGKLEVVHGNGRVNVIADDLPSKACVQAGWLLAKGGTIIVNGTLPMRLSAARLAELCGGDGARLTWIPDEPGR